MLLLVSILSALVIGFIGYRSGRDALRHAALAQLTEVREARAREITRLFDALLHSTAIYSRTTTTVDAVEGFAKGYRELARSRTTPAQDRSVRRYYDRVFVPAVAANTGQEYDPAGFLPTSRAERYLQAAYTVPFTDFEKSIVVDDAGDGSAWSATHAEYHPLFRDIVERFDYEDLLLLDTAGNVVYTAYKGVDLGTNVRTGPFRGTAMAAAYARALTSNTVGGATVVDFERYQPDIGEPVAWAVSPVGPPGRIVGALAVQVPRRSIDAIMTGDEEWSLDGLGTTGEVYLAGPDRLMRSVSRPLIQDPAGFRREVRATSVPATTVTAMLRLHDSILLQPVHTPAVDRALAGGKGTSVAREYLGRESLVAYAPLQAAGLHWGIVAKMDVDEAFAPVTDFTRTLALWTAAIILVVCLASLMLAQTFVRPIGRLLAGVRRVAGGDLDTHVDAHSNDEFGDLADGLNDMASSLRVKADLLEAEQRQSERLLLTLMPESVARRYREGEETIAEDHRDVSVLFADIMGFEDFTADLPSEQALGLLNGLVRGFDEAAERLGIEKVRILRTGYLASCGLVTPRIDNARRTVEFAQAMQHVLARFNAQRGADLSLRAGIDTGTVTTGLVGPSNIVYDMWGDAVSIAHRARRTTGQPGIFLTSHVHEKLSDLYLFDRAGTLDTSSGPEPIWRLQSDPR